MRIAVLTLTLSLFFMGCRAQDGGVAPSLTTNPPPSANAENYIKNGTTILTSGGWEASLDTTDSVEQITLANGWVIEVKNE